MFSRKQIVEPRYIDLNEVVQRTRKMLVRIIGEDVALETQICSLSVPVLADPTQLEQLLLNLAVNSRDALPDGGTIVIETERTSFPPPEKRDGSDSPTGPAVRLTVRDDGTGMTPEVLERVFEPFFTTKPMGRGTGLGLATVYGVVKQSGGCVRINTELGQGTSVHVFLPFAEGEQPELLNTPPPSFQPTRGALLFVEDEAMLRRLGRRVLERAGHEVATAGNAEEALELLRSARKPFELMVTDVVLPGMNGRELAHQARCILPQLRVLYTSGYAEEVLARHGVLEENIQFLAKPYLPASLLGAVERALNAPIAVAEPTPLLPDPPQSGSDTDVDSQD